MSIVFSSQLFLIMYSYLVVLLATCSAFCNGWIILSPSFLSTSPATSSIRWQKGRLYESSSLAAEQQSNVDKDEDDDEDEYEYVEYDILLEEEFTGSEWLIGTVSDDNLNSIKETWVRLAVGNDGKNLAVWGDNSEGSWNFDVASQFLSMSKEKPWGKRIWAGVVDDYYFVQGTVRGWSMLTPASVIGQWQAKRLGVDPEEAGIAPWMPEYEEEAAADENATPQLSSTTTIEKEETSSSTTTEKKEEIPTEKEEISSAVITEDKEEISAEKKEESSSEKVEEISSEASTEKILSVTTTEKKEEKSSTTSTEKEDSGSTTVSGKVEEPVSGKVEEPVGPVPPVEEDKSSSSKA